MSAVISCNYILLTVLNDEEQAPRAALAAANAEGPRPDRTCTSPTTLHWRLPSQFGELNVYSLVHFRARPTTAPESGRVHRSTPSNLALWDSSGSRAQFRTVPAVSFAAITTSRPRDVSSCCLAKRCVLILCSAFSLSGGTGSLVSLHELLTGAARESSRTSLRCTWPLLYD